MNASKNFSSEIGSVNNDVAASSGLQFSYETDRSNIIPILEKRLPKSASIYNMCKMYNNFRKSNEMAFYLMCPVGTTAIVKGIGKEESSSKENMGVLATYYREDYGMQHTISAPSNPIITSEIKGAFVKCPYINWKKHYHFSCIDFEISPMIYEISTQIIGNSISSMPCKIFSISREEAIDLNLTVPADFNSNELSLQPMDKVKGTEFICSTWKYYIAQKTEITVKKLLEKNKSVGLYDRKSGNVICGMCVHDCGLMGMLHTLLGQRGKGYATLVVQQLMKNVAMDEMVPCSAVEIKNCKGSLFHERVGMTFSHFADFIKYVPREW